MERAAVMPGRTRILIAGLPRSGTTWLGHAMAAAPGVAYVHEPDNVAHDPFAAVGTGGLERHPRLRPTQRAPRYALLWDLAFRGGWPVGGPLGGVARMAMRTPRRLRPAALMLTARLGLLRRQPRICVVKTVRALFTLEWVVAHSRPTTVVVVQRNPLNMVAGYRKLRWGSYGLAAYSEPRKRLEPLGLWPDPPQDTVENYMWTLCALTVLEHDSVVGHPDWRVIRHEDLCGDPQRRFAELFDQLGVPWSASVADFLAEADSEGSGWEVRRVAAEQAEAWRRQLSAEDAATALAVLDRFVTVLPAVFAQFVPDQRTVSASPTA